MTDPINLINFGFAIGGLTVAVLGLLLNSFIPYADRTNKRFFIVFFSLLTAYVASDLLSQIFLVVMEEDHRLLSQAAIFAESLFSSLLMPLLLFYLLHCAGRRPARSPLMTIALALWSAYFFLLMSTWLDDSLYLITPGNVYRRGPWYPLLLLPPVLLMLTNLAALFLCRRELSRKQRIAFAVYLSVPLLCMLIQMMSYGLLMTMIGTSVAALFMFVFILQDQVRRYVEQQAKVAQVHAANLALQMRPHFIYNVMTSIYYLIRQDPAKAQQVTLDFTEYLRKNFTVIGTADTVPFSEELAHARAYLAVEQVRFDGSLYTHFDIEETSFRTPPLTLQPIVENAVKHGLDPELDPLHITVSARKTTGGNEIVVEDTGSGFTDTENADPHVALDNIRQRLEMTCGGTLQIQAREGGGTRVVIFVPEGEKA